jgi:hypothetical protein
MRDHVDCALYTMQTGWEANIRYIIGRSASNGIVEDCSDCDGCVLLVRPIIMVLRIRLDIATAHNALSQALGD